MNCIEKIINFIMDNYGKNIFGKSYYSDINVVYDYEEQLI